MRPIDADRLKAVLEKNFGHTGGASVLEQLIDEQPTIQPELIEKTAYIRGFEQGRTQGMIDSQGGKK